MNIVKVLQDLIARSKSGGMSPSQIEQLDAAHSKIRALEAQVAELRAKPAGVDMAAVDAAIAAAGFVTQASLSSTVRTIGEEFQRALSNEVQQRIDGDKALDAKIGDVGSLPDLPPLVQ